MVSLKSVLQFPPFRTSGFFWPEYSVSAPTLEELLSSIKLELDSGVSSELEESSFSLELDNSMAEDEDSALEQEL